MSSDKDKAGEVTPEVAQSQGDSPKMDPDLLAGLAEVQVLADEIDLPPPASVPRPMPVKAPTVLPAAQLFHVRPAEGYTMGGTRLLLEGEHLHRESIVRIDDVLASTIGVGVDGRQLRVITPPRDRPGAVKISVQNPGAELVVMNDAFRYLELPAPKVVSVAPSQGATDGRTELCITGQNFVTESMVIIDGKEFEDFVIVDATTIELKRMPPGKHRQMVDVGVRNPDGKQHLARRAFMYDSRFDR